LVRLDSNILPLPVPGIGLDALSIIKELNNFNYS
jgi:hypothetical protein